MPLRRVLSLWLPALAVERHRALHGPEHAEQPRVLIEHTAHGPRIVAVTDHAAQAGARVGMTLADARALCPRIEAAEHDSEGDHAFLEQLAGWAGRWGPWVALDPPDGLLVDVTALAHLFGGEADLIDDVGAVFQRRDLTVRPAIAPTAGAAWALAHYGAAGSIQAPSVAETLPTILANLPIAALRLDNAVITVLRRLGIKQVGQLAGLESGANGRDAIQRRFRNRRDPATNPLIRLDQLLGRLPEPLLPVIPVVPPLVQRRLMEPIRHRELLDRVAADLAQDMAHELERRGEGARRLELGLWRVDGQVTVRVLEMASASRDAAHIARLFAGKLDAIDAGFGIELVRLRASWTEPLNLAQPGLDDGEARPGTSLSVCIDRLSVRLGAKAVSRPVPFASHLPERAQRWQPPLDPEPASQGRLAFHDRPLKLLDKPEEIAVLYATPDGYPQRFRWRGGVHDVLRVEGPERIAPEWWREPGGTRLRDYYRIEDGAGRRYWIYRSGLIGDGRGGVPEWYLQGLCA